MFKKVIIRRQSLAFCKFVCAMDYFCNLFYLLSGIVTMFVSR